MANKNVGLLDIGVFQQIVQFDGDVTWGAGGAAWAAPAEAAAIVGCCAGEAGDGFLNVEPVEISGGDGGFKEHGRSARAFFEQVEFALAPDGYPAAGTSEAQAIAMTADVLIKKSHAYQGCSRTSEP